jgi:glycosyltransferase involved in cell wall biosynthesis
MRILYLNYEWDERESTGAFTHIRELSRGLTALGHTVRVVDRHRILAAADARGAGGPRERATASFASLCKARLSPFLHEAAAMARALRGVARETALIREARPDVVLTRHSLHQFSSIVASHRCGVPVVYEVNAPAAYEYRRYRRRYHLVPGFAEWLEARMLARADGLFVVSELLERHFVERGVRPERIRVVPNGADVGRFHPAASDPEVRKRLGEASVVVGFVGSFARFHGIDQLQRAIDFLCGARTDVRFLLVGSGELSEDLKAHCLREGLDGRVHFAGHVPPEQVPGLMASADILLAPYEAQEFFYLSPIKIFEYMAVGRAVLAAGVGQIGEIIEDGVTGLLYDPADLRSLTDSLIRLVEDPALRRRLGESARKAVEERYTWQANARAVAGLLEEAVARHRSGRGDVAGREVAFR